jgi:cytochrome oxidase Cu insertion factor (SCO1/SenC/PrrC family)
MTEQENRKISNQRIKFIALILVFLSPFIAGWLAFYVFEVRPDSHHYGTLVEPVRPLSFPQLTSLDERQINPEFWRKWTFVVIDNDGCQQQCQQNLYYLRQTRIALGRDAERVQNVLMLNQPADEELRQFLEEYPALTVMQSPGSEITELFDVPGFTTGDTPMLYLIDPAGNLMMTFPAVNEPKSILSDLRRLLKVSQIG